MDEVLPREKSGQSDEKIWRYHLPPRPRRSGLDGPGPPSWGQQRALDALTTACAAAAAADQVYDSMDALAAAWHASLATLSAMPTFRTWERSNPTFKPRLSGFLWTEQGPRRVTVLLDTGATHCFILARLAAALGLQPAGQPGPTSVSTAAAWGELGLAAPGLLHLVLGNMLREAMSVSSMYMDASDDLVLDWDWISSHDLHHLYIAGRVCLRSGSVPLQLDLLPARVRPIARTLQVIGHGEFCWLLQQVERETQAATDPPPPPTPLPQLAAVLHGSTGWSRPLHHAELAELAAVEVAAAARADHRNRGRAASAASPTGSVKPCRCWLRGNILATSTLGWNLRCCVFT